MKNKFAFILMILLGVCWQINFLHAQAPNLLNYQGKLIISGVAVSGPFSMTFSIYPSETGGTALWTETQTVTITKGVFNVMLGSVTPFPNTLFSSAGDRFLGIKVGADPEIAPRFRLTSAAFAIRAREAEGVADGAITQTKFAPNVSLPPSGDADGDLAGTYPNPTIAASRVDSTKLASNAVTSSKIAAGAINNSDLANGAVTNAKIAMSTVDSTRLDASAVTATALAANAVITSRIADGAVTQAKLAVGVSLPISGTAGGDLTDTFPNPTIAPNKVDSTKLTANSVTSAKIAAGAISNSDLASNAVTAAKIANGQVVKNFNGLTDAVTLIQGSNVKLTTSGNTITIESTAAGVPSINNITGPLKIIGRGGATVTNNLDSIIVTTASGPGATGIQGIQNTNNTLDITSSTGPIATINVKTNGIANAQLADNAVTSLKIADGAITNSDISLVADIDENKLALNFSTHSNANDPTVTEKAALAGTNGVPSNTNRYVMDSDIRNMNARTPAGTAAGDLTGTYPSPTIKDNAVTSAKILDGTIIASDISPNIVSSLDGVNNDGGDIDFVAGSNITIASDDVANTIMISATGGTGDITDVVAGVGLSGGGTTGSVTLAVATSGIIGTMIQDGQVGNLDLAADAVTSAKIQDNTITTADVSPNLVSSLDGVNNDGGDIDLVAGTNITITPNDVANTITIAATALGDITDVVAGSGLSGGSTSGSATLSVATDGITSAMIQDNTITTTDVSPAIVSSLENVSNDGGNIDLVAGSNITIASDDIVNTITISATGGTGDITDVLAGSGLSGGGTTGSVTLSVATGGIIGTMIQDGQVGNLDLAADAVTSAKIQDNTITTADVSPNLVSSLDGVNNDGGDIDLVAGTNITITPNDVANTITIAATALGDITDVVAGSGLSGGSTSGSATLSVATDGITSAMIQDNTITTTDVSPAIVSSLENVSNDGGNIDLVAGSNITIASDDIVNTITISATGGTGDITDVLAGSGLSGGGTTGSVTLSVATGGITGTMIQDGQVGNLDLAADAVTSAKIQDNTITTADVSPNLVSSLDGVNNDGGDIDLVAGTNITITPNDVANTITIAATALGDITDVVAGSGLSGGSTSGSATLSVATDGITSAMIQDNTITTTDVSPAIVSSLENVSNDGGNIDLVAGSNITIASDDIVNTITISATGGTGDITDVLAGSGLSGGGTTGSVTLSVATGGITGTMIQDGQVGNLDLAADAVTSAKIQDNTITTADVSPNLVSSLDGVSNDGGDIDLIAGTNITITPNDVTNTIMIAATGTGGDITDVLAGAGLSGGGTSGSVTLSVATGGITSIMIQDNTVVSTDLADGSVGSVDIADGAVGSADIFDGAIGAVDITDNAISSAKIQDNTITTSDVSPNLVSSIAGVSNDGGDIDLVAGNSNITITPNDASNSITISANSLSLPFSGSSSSSGTLFEITTTGAGNAGTFEIDNTSSSANALFVKTNGVQEALYSLTNGNTNNAGYFQIDNTDNNSAAVSAETNGGGNAGKFETTGSGFAGAFLGMGGSSKGVSISAPAGQVGLQVTSGTKNAVVATSQGARLLYTEESSEVWFTDYGFGRLQNGQAVIAFDPIFTETVNLNEPYHVFVQAYGDAEIYVSQRTPTAFTVRLREGDPNVEFSYRLVAKRRGYERDRLKRAPWAEEDPNLYPEKRAAWEAKHKPQKKTRPSRGSEGRK